MATPSDSDNASSAKGAKSDRAGLPFEPKGSRKRSGKDSDDSAVKGKQAKPKKTSSKKADKKNEKSEGSTSAVSAKAQARVEEIRAMRQRRADKSNADASETEKSVKGRSKKAQSKKSKSSGRPENSGAIPEAVSRRMLRRMGVLSGSPVLLGVGVFFLAYYLQSNEIVTFDPVVVLLATMGCFGLGVLGLTYGVLSASWDDEPGSLVGLSEFKLNFSRVMDARRASKT